MNERVCFACNSFFKDWYVAQCQVPGRKWKRRTRIRTRHQFQNDSKMGNNGFSLRSSHSSSSKTILFLTSPPHLSNSGSFQTNYKKKFVKEKGKSNYSIMLEPPDVKHAMDVAKKQSNVSSSSHSLGPTCTRGSHTGVCWPRPSEGSPEFLYLVV